MLWFTGEKISRSRSYERCLEINLSSDGSIDFGIDTLMEHAEKTEFPWLMSNVIDNETGRPLAEGKVSHTVDWWGRKVGLVSTLALHNFFFHIYSIFYKKDDKTTTSFLPVLFSFYG